MRTALISINESTLSVRAWCWTRNYTQSFDMRCDILESVKKRFDAEGIDLAYPHTTITFKDEDLFKNGSREETEES